VLRAVQRISELVQGDLDLERTLAAVTQALMSVAGFSGVRVEIAVDVEGRRLQRMLQAGRLDETTATVPLRRHGRAIGQLVLWPPPSVQRHELLDAILPTIATAIDNAARHEALMAERAALGTLVKGLLHELRNPANGIVHSVRLLREHLPEAVRQAGSAVGDLLEVATTCAQQIESSCRDLLGTTGHGDPARKMVPFGTIVDRARAIVSGSLGHTQLIETERYDGEVYCSDRLLAQVLANLFKNGAQAAGGSGWVKIASRRSGDRVLVEVRDSGPGVPPELRERIFQLYFTTKSPGEGTGLGLHLSRQIVLRHEGVLEVRDTPDGPAFCVELPLGPAAGPGASVAVAPARLADGAWRPNS
jgi:signal transduction histidine kinase